MVFFFFTHTHSHTVRNHPHSGPTLCHFDSGARLCVNNVTELTYKYKVTHIYYLTYYLNSTNHQIMSGICRLLSRICSCLSLSLSLCVHVLFLYMFLGKPFTIKCGPVSWSLHWNQLLQLLFLKYNYLFVSFKIFPFDHPLLDHRSDTNTHTSPSLLLDDELVSSVEAVAHYTLFRAILLHAIRSFINFIFVTYHST